MSAFDVFVSYRRKDASRVQVLVDALRGRGLKVWFDQTAIGDFESITGDIRKGLAESKTLLAWYSAGYLRSRPCQMELTAAFIAASRDGDVRRRVLVVNPETSTGHIQPVELRDELFRKALVEGDEAGPAALADAVAAHVARLETPLGATLPVSLPPHYPLPLTGSSHFVGRLADLWRVHSVLSAAENAIISGRYASGPAQVYGMGGVGKSLLAEEYAVRFGAAYPGGVFWLRALGHDPDRAPRSPEELEAQRTSEIARFAVRLGLRTEGLKPEEIESSLARALGEQGRPFLWVVDDLPGGLGAEDVRRWLAPHPMGRSLITTRSGRYGAIGEALPLDVLPREDAYELLTHRRRPTGDEEKEAASRLCEDLGFHALALDVAASALAKWPDSVAAFRREIAEVQGDELEGLVVKLADELPNGHEKSIAATLLRSFRALPEEGRDFLRLASHLAPAPIPFRLVVAAFKVAGSSDEPAARKRAIEALGQCADASLAEGGGEQARRVHALVSRMVRFHDVDPGRRERLGQAAIAALGEVLPAVADIRRHQELELEVIHARTVCQGREDIAALGLMSWVGRHDFERGAYAGARALFEKELGASRRVVGEDHPHTLTSMHNLTQTLWAHGDRADARAVLEKVLEAYRRILGEEHRYTLVAMDNLALVLRAQGDLAGARALHETVLETRRRVLGKEHPDTLSSMNNLALALKAQGDLAGARALHETVLQTRRRVLGEEHPDTLTSMNNLAQTLRAYGDLDRARALNEQELAVCRRVLGEEHPDTLTSMNNLAVVLEDQGDLSGARVLQERLLETRRRVLGEEHPGTLMSMGNLGSTLQAEGDLPGARALFEKALEAFRRVLGGEHPDTLMSMSNLAVVLEAQGDLAGARALDETVLKTRGRVLGKEHPDTLTSMNNLAQRLRGHGDLSGARALHEKVREARRRALGEEHPDTLGSMNNLALVLGDQGELSGARALHEKALDAYRRVLGEEHPDTLMSMSNLALVLGDQGDLSGARALQERVLDASRRVLGEEHPDTLTSMNNLAATLWGHGALSGARALQEKVIGVSRRVLGEEHPFTLTSMNNLATMRWDQGDLSGARALQEKVLNARRRVLGEEHPDTLTSMNNLALTLQAQPTTLPRKGAGLGALFRRLLHSHGRARPG